MSSPEHNDTTPPIEILAPSLFEEAVEAFRTDVRLVAAVYDHLREGGDLPGSAVRRQISDGLPSALDAAEANVDPEVDGRIRQAQFDHAIRVRPHSTFARLSHWSHDRATTEQMAADLGDPAIAVRAEQFRQFHEETLPQAAERWQELTTPLVLRARRRELSAGLWLLIAGFGVQLLIAADRFFGFAFISQG